MFLDWSNSVCALLFLNFRPKDDGEIKQPVRLLPVLETTDPSPGHVGAGGPGVGGQQADQQQQTKRQGVPAVESGQRGETFIYI